MAAATSLLGACNHADEGQGAQRPAAQPMTNGAPQPGYAGQPQPGYAGQPQQGAYQPPPSGGPQPVVVPSPAQTPQIPSPQDGSWSLLERQQWAALSHDFTRNFLDPLNDRCSSRVEGVFIFESFRGRFTDSQDRPLGGAATPIRDHAMAPFLAVQNICSGGGEMEKSTVRAKVRRIEIRLVPSGNSSFVFNDGVLHAMINPADGISESTYQEFVSLELKKRL